LEAEILPALRELGIGLVPYSPLGRGFLTGSFKAAADLAEGDFRKNNPRFQGENFEQNIALVKTIEDIAVEESVSAAQVALAWVLAQGDDVVPIPGTKRRKYLSENIAAADLVLTDAELARLADVFGAGAAAGTRYAEAAMAGLNR
jgi:aryl-alcohol dehydrogenase-like predicted oxidoreductase